MADSEATAIGLRQHFLQHTPGGLAPTTMSSQRLVPTDADQGPCKWARLMVHLQGHSALESKLFPASNRCRSLFDKLCDFLRFLKHDQMAGGEGDCRGVDLLRHLRFQTSRDRHIV